MINNKFLHDLFGNILTIRKKYYAIFLFMLFLLFIQNVNGKESEGLTLSVNKLLLLTGETKAFNASLKGQFNESITINFILDHDIVHLKPQSIVFPKDEMIQNATINRKILIFGIDAGHVDITIDAIPTGYIDTEKLFLKVAVHYSNVLYLISNIAGWLYFIAWSSSFYPQIYINFRRKSVVGLNFDYVALNIVGYTFYSLFNICLYAIPYIQAQYFEQHPRSFVPVHINDIFFSIHGLLATLFIIFQCYIYQRGNQTVSIAARSLLCVYAIIMIASCILVGAHVITWLDFLYYCSYVKLSVTLIKYIPQAYMNYNRKSTTGWSIGNIFLDLAGGILSMLQMIMDAYNFNDWRSIFGDLTKFGLGLFTVIFDLFFMIQHYVLYRSSSRITYFVVNI